MQKRWPLLLTSLAIASAGLWTALSVSSSQHPETARYTDRQPGIALIAGFKSYSTLDAATSRLASQSASIDRRRLTRPPDRRYPPRVLDTLTIKTYPLLATQGRLRLEYFNDRLYEVSFKPDDAAASAAALKHAYPELRRDRNGRAERVVGAQRLATNVELSSSTVGQVLATEPYVLWQDQRLIFERDEWDQRFGALPYRAE